MPGQYSLYLLCNLSAVVRAVLCHLGSDPPSFQGRLLPSSPHLGPGGGGWFHKCCRWKWREGEGQNRFLRSLKGAPVGRPLHIPPGLWWWSPWSALLLGAVLEVSPLGALRRWAQPQPPPPLLLLLLLPAAAGWRGGGGS